MRIAGPVVIGATRLPVSRFAALNMIGAAVCAVLVAGAGYYFGMGLDAPSADLRHVEEAVLVGILAVGFIWWLWRRKRAT